MSRFAAMTVARCPFTTIVRVTIRTLRLKLGQPVLIETLVGAGYRIAG